ncbi:MAG: hypothetical protein C0614_10380 [Desulfuromonas sp.]|nr:MAG: hypothetical protein C0614_10380 [Desulfuromonas sp.]
MLITVELIDGNRVTVFQEGLENLLEHNLVKRFKRKSGWAIVGFDPIRSNPSLQISFDGYERRHQNHSTRILQ